MAVAYRPSHADATYDMKYGIRAVSPSAQPTMSQLGLHRVQVARAGSMMLMLAQVAGGGRSSARETIGRVAAGAVAKKLLETVAGVEVICHLSPLLTLLLPIYCSSSAGIAHQDSQCRLFM